MDHGHHAGIKRDLSSSVTSRLEDILRLLQNPGAAMEPTHLLLKYGVVIVHGANDHATAVKTDLLIKGNQIVDMSTDIATPADTTVVDCTDKIIAPGFIDTHRHMYTIGLRGRHGNNLLTDYIVQGKSLSSNNHIPTISYRARYTPELKL